MYKGIYILGALFLLISVACNKNLNDINSKDELINGSDKSLDIYLLENYETFDTSMEIIESTASISSEKLISYADILYYDKKNHIFKVSQSAMDMLLQSDNFHSKAFAITIDDEIIYTGYFWYGYASSICDRITIDPILLNGTNELRVKLGYPGDSFTRVSTDDRNAPRIINLLQKDNKLLN